MGSSVSVDKLAEAVMGELQKYQSLAQEDVKKATSVKSARMAALIKRVSRSKRKSILLLPQE